MSDLVKRASWTAGAPVRFALIALVRLYRVTLGGFAGGRCRFYPSCSHYAEQAIGQCGAVRGLALSAWRILRCSPLSSGGVDYPPAGRGYASEYVSVIRSKLPTVRRKRTPA